MDSLVSIVIRYRLDGPGIQSRWGRDFLYPSRPALGPNQPPIQWVPGLSRGVNRPPIPIQLRGYRKNRAILQLPLCAFVACSRANFNFVFLARSLVIANVTLSL